MLWRYRKAAEQKKNQAKIEGLVPQARRFDLYAKQRKKNPEGLYEQCKNQTFSLKRQGEKEKKRKEIWDAGNSLFAELESKKSSNCTNQVISAIKDPEELTALQQKVADLETKLLEKQQAFQQLKEVILAKTKTEGTSATESIQSLCEQQQLTPTKINLYRSILQEMEDNQHSKLLSNNEDLNTLQKEITNLNQDLKTAYLELKRDSAKKRSKKLSEGSNSPSKKRLLAGDDESANTLTPRKRLKF